MFLKKNINLILIIFIFLLIGIITSIYKGYGDDLDSHSLILSYINIYENGIYSASRFYGSPFAEFFYGFIGYNYGSFLGSFLSYIFFTCSVIFLLIGFSEKKIKFNDLSLFVILCFSNPVLYLDNTNPSDYPLSLFFFSLGIFLFKKHEKIFSIIFFALAIATRANYALFVLGYLLYEILYKKDDFKINLCVLIYSFLIGSLFYLPILIQYKLSLSFISNGGGPDLTLASLIPRFIYKIYLSLGIFSSIFVLFFIIFNFKKFIKLILEFKTIALLIFLNLAVFMFMPTKTSIISLFVVLLYILVFKFFNKKLYLYVLILLNFIYYFSSYNFFTFEYKYSEKCGPIEAIGAKIDFKISKGYLFERTIKMKNQIECASSQFNDQSIKYISGKKIRSY